MTGLRELRLVVPGRPVQWARATGGRTVRHFTPAAQRTYAQRIQAEWIHAGRPRLEDGPIVLVCRFILARPKAHWTSRGELSATGRRQFWPTGRPDLSNYVKQVEDALNGLAWADDSLIVGYGSTNKRYQDRPDEPERVEITAHVLTMDWTRGPEPEAVAA